MSSNGPIEAAHPPPPGEQSNFIDPPTIQPAIIGALAVCLALSTFSAVLRCYAQWSLFKKLLWADFWGVLGWAFQVVFVGLLFACLPYGGGRHIWDVTKKDFAQIQFYLFIDYILYGCAILGAKMSILLQLVAIFVPRGRDLASSARWFYWTAVFLMAVNLLFYISHNFLLIFQCTPIEKGWNPSVPGHCMDQVSLLVSSGPFNIISDFLIFLLPLSLIWQLKLPIRTRLGIASAFAVGLFGCICSGVRLWYSNRLNSTGDVTYFTFQNQLWANAEITATVLIANVIILPRFVRFKRGITSSREYANNSNNYRISKHRSTGGQRSSKFIQRKTTSDPYIELEDGASGAQSRNDAQSEDHQQKIESGEGIMRTIRIDTVNEASTPYSSDVHAITIDKEPSFEGR